MVTSGHQWAQAWFLIWWESSQHAAEDDLYHIIIIYYFSLITHAATFRTFCTCHDNAGVDAVIQRLWIPTAINRRRRWCVYMCGMCTRLLLFSETWRARSCLYLLAMYFIFCEFGKATVKKSLIHIHHQQSLSERFARPMRKHLSSDLEGGKMISPCSHSHMTWKCSWTFQG